MKIVHCEQVALGTMHVEGSENCQMCCLIGPDDAAPSFSMRLFEVAPGGHTPKHTHAHEHELFILEGTGIALEGDREHAIRPGTAVFVPPDQLHQFRNTGAGAMKFLCFIPHPLRGVREICVAACGCDG